MDKLYTLQFSKYTPTPSKESLQLILQFSAAYEPIEVGDTSLDFIAN